MSCSVGGVPFDVPAGSCCQKAACNLPCPSSWTSRSALDSTFGTATVLSIAVYCAIGIGVLVKIRGRVSNFFVAGRSLGLFVATLALAGQSLDSNATLGNADLSYRAHTWDGMVLPMGLGISLLLNGLLLARHVNAAQTLTLPDLYARTYGKLFEVLVSLVLCTSFISLLAGNLVGLGRIFSFCFEGLGKSGAIWLGAALCVSYTIGGGLVSVVYADVVQSITGIFGLIVCAAYMLENRKVHAPEASIGFPGYIYPNAEICALYEGVPGAVAGNCIYNEAKWGSAGVDNGAWPIGDQAIRSSEMRSFEGLAPFPNAVFYNWATLAILGLGNLSALDFQARCMAAKTPRIATIGCIIAGLLSFAVGIPFSYMGGFTRLYYGPDSPYAEFSVDTCSTTLGTPSCGQWVPDENATLKLFTKQFPVALGCWCLVGIVAASMSTATGVLLAISTVLSHNVGRKIIKKVRPGITITQDMLLFIVRSTVPVTCIIAAVVASSYNKTGYLLVVAFDIALAGTIAPLLASVYTPSYVTPAGGVCSLLGGILLRCILEGALPKDGSFIMPYGQYNYNYGTGIPNVVPAFSEPAGGLETWDPAANVCKQPRYSDYSGVDSLCCPIFGAILLYSVSYLDRRYRKDSDKSKLPFIPSSWLEPVAAPKDIDAAVDQ